MPSIPDIVRRIKRGLDIPSQAAEAIARNVQGVVQVGSVAEWWETDDLTTRAAIGYGNSTAAAAERAVIGLINPVGSHVNLITEQLVITIASAGQVAIRVVDAATAASGLANNEVTAFRDFRAMTLPVTGTGFDNPIGLVKEDSVAALFGDNIGSIETLDDARAPVQWPVKMLLKPNSALLVIANTVQVNLRCMFVWNEVRLVR